jgi:hypothetical protein
MRSLFLFALLLVATQARADRVVSPTVYVSSAQADAQQMASTGVLRHSGRAGGRREGIGMGATPEAAMRACCFYGQHPIVERAVAWSPLRRMWFAVIRYR